MKNRLSFVSNSSSSSFLITVEAVECGVGLASRLNTIELLSLFNNSDPYHDTYTHLASVDSLLADMEEDLEYCLETHADEEYIKDLSHKIQKLKELKAQGNVYNLSIDHCDAVGLKLYQLLIAHNLIKKVDLGDS